LIKALAEAEPGTPAKLLHEAFQTAKRVAEASTIFFSSPKDEDPTKIELSKVTKARRYPWTGRGDVNTYALFAEHFLNLANETGKAGIIVPTGIATDATTAPFFGHLVSSQRLAGLIDFENSAPLFAGVHRSFKFCLLTIGSGVAEADFAFFLTDPVQLEQAERRFTLTPAQIARINPNTKTAPVFRARRDAELTAAIYDRVPVLIDECKRDDGNQWGLSFMAMFHMSNDSSLFRTAKQLESAGYFLEKTKWRKVNAVNYVPVYEAKMTHQFDHRFGDYGARGNDRGYRVMPETPLANYQNPDFEPQPFYWVRDDEVASRLAARHWSASWLFGWKEITASTNERTFVASFIPNVGVGHKFLLMLAKCPARVLAALAANLNSLALDSVTRQKLSGLSLSYFVLKQLPILPPSAYDESALSFIVPRVLELTYTSYSMAPFARDLSYDGPPFAWDEDRRAKLRAELDAWYALAYGLNRDELRYILDPKDVMGEDYPSETFRVLQKNELARHDEYRTRRLVLAAYDELTAQGMRPRTEGYLR
jgi:hypothetical protein